MTTTQDSLTGNGSLSLGQVAVTTWRGVVVPARRARSRQLRMSRPAPCDMGAPNSNEEDRSMANTFAVIIKVTGEIVDVAEFARDEDAQEWFDGRARGMALVVLDLNKGETAQAGDLVDVDADGVATIREYYPSVKATASNARPSDTGVDNGLDVDVVVWIDDGNPQVAPQRFSGEVTLVQDHNGDWSSWGQADHWVDGALLAELKKLPNDAFRSALETIEAEASDVADEYRTPTYQYTIFDADPDSSSGTQWTSHADIELEADSDEAAVAAVRDLLETEAAGLSEIDEYEVGQRIYALIWTPDGTVEKISHELTADDLA